MLKKLVYITNEFLNDIVKVKLPSMVKELRSFNTDFSCSGKNFLMGYLSTESDLIQSGVHVMQEFEEQPGQAEKKYSVILRTTLDKQAEAFTNARENLKQAMLIENEQICSFIEYRNERVIASTRGTHYLFEGACCVASFSDNSPNKYFKNANDFPMGYFWTMPGFDPEKFPFLVTCGD